MKVETKLMNESRVNLQSIYFIFGGIQVEKLLRKLIPKLSLYNFSLLVKLYEVYAFIRYRKKFYEILEFRKSRFVIGRDLTLFPSVYLGIYEENELDILFATQLPQEMIFWDVGANVGIYSVLLGKKFPRGKIIAFEPNLSLHSLLMQNLDLNQVTNVKIEKFGLSNTRGFVQFEISEKRAGAGKILSSSVGNAQLNSIPVITGDMYIKDFPEFKPNIIKIDVEGHEPEVVEGCLEVLREIKPVLIIEVFSNLWDSDRDDIWDHALNTLFDIYDHGTLISDGKILYIEKWNLEYLTGGMQTLIFGNHISRI